MSDDLIDQLMADYNATPEKKKAPRKGNNKKLAAAKKPDGNIPAAVQEATLAWTMAKGLVEGRSTHEIAEEYGMNREAVKKILAAAMGELLEDTANLMLNWATITLQRTERMLEMLYPRLTIDGIENPTAYELFRSIYKDQMEIIKFMMPKQGNSSEWDKATSIASGGELYNEANQAINENYRNGIVKRENEISDLDGIILDGVAVNRNTKSK